MTDCFSRLNSRFSRAASIAAVLLASSFVSCGGGSTSGSSTPTPTPTPTPSTSGTWTWVSGSNTAYALAVYGTLGVASSSSNPGARISAASWRDSSGNVWLFGGQGADSTGLGGFFNDLWQYNPIADTWKWVGGPNVAESPGVYGTQGVPSADNVPGARSGAASWIDRNGSLWLFGGYGHATTWIQGYLNDLWQYNPTSGMWTWIAGSNTVNDPGVYGTLGVASSSNFPSSRNDVVTWTDSVGTFWLLGGNAYVPLPVQGSFMLEDLWKFDPTNKTWTWMGGSTSTNTQPVYGTQGVAAATNIPGARSGSSGWTDSAGNLWFFGGFIASNSFLTAFRNDLWKYSPTTNLWTWVGGSTSTNVPGVYGTKGVASSSNTPGARSGASSWTDNSGNLWLFGGTGFDAAAALDALNDLWKYNAASNSWTWVGGNDKARAPGVYGNQGTPSANNVPGGRASSITWVDSNGNVWLFGGGGVDSTGYIGGLNDIWRYQP